MRPLPRGPGDHSASPNATPSRLPRRRPRSGRSKPGATTSESRRVASTSQRAIAAVGMPPHRSSMPCLRGRLWGPTNARFELHPAPWRPQTAEGSVSSTLSHRRRALETQGSKLKTTLTVTQSSPSLLNPRRSVFRDQSCSVGGVYCHFPLFSCFNASSTAAFSCRSNPLSSSSGVFSTQMSGSTP